MTQTGTMRVLRGLGALVVILGLTVGLPIGLWLAVGWPLPHVIPMLADVGTSLTQSQLSDHVIIKILAIICWLCWLQLTTSILVETVAAVRRRPARQLFGAGPLQVVAAELITAVLFIASLQPKTAVPTASPTLIMQPALSVTGSQQSAIPPPTPDAPTASQTSQAAESPQVATETSTYTVRHLDTLWSIADAKLGDPQRWNEIFELNQGRKQVDGAVFDKARLIRPGWVLELPPDAQSAPPTQAAAPVIPPPTASTPITSTPSLSLVPTHPDTASSSNSSSSMSTTVAETAEAGTTSEFNEEVLPEPQHRPVPAQTAHHDSGPLHSGVVLASGSVVGMSTAIGIAGALGLVRLRRRRRYQPGEPRSGIASGDPLLTDSIKRLAYATHNIDSDETNSATSVTPAPGLTSISDHDGTEILEDLTKVGITALREADALHRARAMVVSFLAHRGDDETQVVVVGDDLGRELFADLGPMPGLRLCPSLVDVLHELDIEVAQRARLLEEADVTDINKLRAAWPEEPVPALLVVMRPGAQLVSRLEAIAKAGRRFGIGFVIVDEANKVTTTQNGNRPTTSRVDDVDQDNNTYYGLSALEATEILGTLTAARIVDDNAVEYPSLNTEPFEPPDTVEHSNPKLVNVTVLGPLSITVNAAEVSAGLRSGAWELLAFLALRPKGVTKELAIEIMWPTKAHNSAISDFRAAVNSLRTELRVATGRRDLQFVERINGRFRLNAVLIDCDLWELEANLERIRTATAGEKLTAVDAAIASYAGPLAAGSDYLWSEECREDLKNRVLDALNTAAKLHELNDDLNQALEALERAAEIEPANEATQIEVMRLQGLLGLYDAATRTMRRLRREAERLGTRPSPTATKLYADLQNENTNR